VAVSQSVTPDSLHITLHPAVPHRILLKTLPNEVTFPVALWQIHYATEVDRCQ
jgi:hypothetical protein